jgi:hypothetical protein
MKFLKLVLVLLFFASCSHQPCKIEERAEASVTGEQKKTSSQQKDLSGRVFVYKADGSLQCGQGSRIAPEDMKKELGAIQVFSAENKSDGMMRIQVCGAPTGMVNVYEIDQKNLEAALKLGFKKWMK